MIIPPRGVHSAKSLCPQLLGNRSKSAAWYFELSGSFQKPTGIEGKGFGPIFAAEIRKRRVEGMRSCRWRWHLDEVFVKVNGGRHHLWRALKYEGLVLESVDPKTRNKTATLKFLRKAMKRHGQPEVIITDRLRSLGAALKELGAASRQETGRWLNNRAENSHLPFRRRERAMLRYRRMRGLQKFAAVHASVTNHFNRDLSLSSRHLFKLNRAAALAEWRGICAA